VLEGGHKTRPYTRCAVLDVNRRELEVSCTSACTFSCTWNPWIRSRRVPTAAPAESRQSAARQWDSTSKSLGPYSTGA